MWLQDKPDNIFYGEQILIIKSKPKTIKLVNQWNFKNFSMIFIIIYTTINHLKYLCEMHHKPFNLFY